MNLSSGNNPEKKIEFRKEAQNFSKFEWPRGTLIPRRYIVAYDFLILPTVA